MKAIFVVFFSLISISIIACSSNKVAKQDNAVEAQMSSLDKETKHLIGSASCTSASQCHSIGFGHKPCGGFYSYRIYSDKNTDVSKLESKVNQYNALSRELNKKNNLVSNCMMLIQPQLVCRDKSCQIK